MATSHSCAFRASFRRRAFGWRGTRKAIERLNEAVSKIERMARTDPAPAGEGAVPLLEKLSPSVSDIDSSSGALGNATAGVPRVSRAMGHRPDGCGSALGSTLRDCGGPRVMRTTPAVDKPPINWTQGCRWSWAT